MFVSFVIDFYFGYYMFCYHMFYKATLFMVLGVMVHIFFNIQDIRLLAFSYSFFFMVSIIILTVFDSVSMYFVFGFYVKDFAVDFLLSFEFFCFEFLLVGMCWFWDGLIEMLVLVWFGLVR
eukprot:PhF_6_TR26061/c0_g1_i1/m.36733